MASRGVNKAIILGVLGRDPEMKYTSSGDAVCSLSIATSETWKDKNTGEQQESTEWHRVVAFRKPAEIIGQWTKKGSKIYIEGHLKTRQWEQDGQKRYSTEIIVDQFQFVDKPDGDKGAAPTKAQASTGENRHPTRPAQDHDDDGFDDDIPF